MAQAMAEQHLPQQHEYQQLGAYLRDLRVYFALDVMEVSRRTHIRAKYIQAIEDGQLDVMPGRVYARGYVVTYAEFFGLNAEEFASRYMAQFGFTQTPTKEEPTYFVPEPTRRKLSKRNTNVVVLGAVVVLAAFAGWALMGGEERVQEPTVAAVPERLIEQLRTGAMVHPENAECLLGNARALACLDAQRAPVMPGYVQKPPMFFVESAREDTATDEDSDATTSEDVASEDVAAEDADTGQRAAADAEASAPSPAAAVAKKPAPAAAVKPAETPREAQAAPATEATQPANTPATQPAAEAVPAVAPFKRQGEEAPPEVASPESASQATEPNDVAPDAAPQPTPQPAPGAEAEENDSLLPKEWFEPREQNYQDPNAPRQDGWSPRERRR